MYDLFGSSLLKMKSVLVGEKEKHPVVMASYSGRAMMARLKKRELQRIVNVSVSCVASHSFLSEALIFFILLQRLNDAEWMLLSGKGEEVRSQFKKISESVDDYVKDLHRKWLDALDDDVPKLLDRKLLVYSTSRPGLLEPNFDRYSEYIAKTFASLCGCYLLLVLPDESKA